MKKILAILAAFAMLLSFAACGNKDDNTTTTTEPTSESDVADDISEDAGAADDVEDSTEPASDEVSEDASDTSDVTDTSDTSDVSDTTVPGEINVSDTTTKAGETTKAGTTKAGATTKAGQTTTAAKKKTIKDDGYSTNNVNEVVDYYLKAAKNTDKNVSVNRTKTLKDFNGGNSALGKILTSLKGAIAKSLENGSGTQKGVRGNLQYAKASDVASASAKTSGNYTTVTMTLKDYNAAATSRGYEGSTGHFIGALDTISEAINDIAGLNTDFHISFSVNILYNEYITKVILRQLFIVE